MFGKLRTLSNPRAQRGQVLTIMAVGIPIFLVFVALAVDGGHWAWRTIEARNALNVACVHAANTVWRGSNGYSAFQFSLQENGIDSEAYDPNEGTGSTLTRGYEYDGFSKSIRTALKYEIGTFFLQIVGFDRLPVVARERCTTTGAFITPIAVKTSAFEDSLENGTWIQVVGQGSQADIDSGQNYRGVVFPFIWCVESDSDYSPNTNCPYPAAFWPLQESPPSAQTAKNLLAEYCWDRLCNRVFTPVGMRLATVSGTSNNQLCKAASDAGLTIGAEFIAIIYDGEVITPESGYGNWENIGVLGWGTFKVVNLEPTVNNCNSLVAIATGGIYSSPQQIPGELFPREIPWDAQGGWDE